MRTRLRSALSSAVLLGMFGLTGLVGTAEAATPAAATTPPVVSAATSTDTPAGRELEVTASSPVGIQAISLSLTSTDASGPVTNHTVTDFTLVQGTPQNGVWASGVVTFDEGLVFSESVDAVDTTGAHIATPFTGSYDNRESPVFHDSTITPGTLTYGRERITAAGRLTAYDPTRGDTGQPYSARAMFSSMTISTTVLPVSPYCDDCIASDGTFSLSTDVSFKQFSTGLFTLVFRDQGVTAYGPSAAVSMGSATPTRILLDRTSAAIQANKGVAINGDIQYLDSTDQTWKPLPYAPYMTRTGNSPWPTNSEETVLADANGHFVTSFSPTSPLTLQYAIDTKDHWDPYLADATATFKVTSVGQALALQLNGAQMDEFSDLTVYGGYTSTNQHLPGDRIHLLQSSNGRTGWKDLGWAPADDNGVIDITAYVNNPHGYWRLYSPAAPGYPATFSNVVHTFRYLTTLTGGRPGTTSAHRGGTLGFSGGLWEQGMGGFARMGGGQRVYLLFKPHGSRTWRLVSYGRTDRNGDWSLHGRATTSGTWEVAWYTGDTRHVDAFGPATYVRVG